MLLSRRLLIRSVMSSSHNKQNDQSMDQNTQASKKLKRFDEREVLLGRILEEFRKRDLQVPTDIIGKLLLFHVIHKLFHHSSL